MSLRRNPNAVAVAVVLLTFGVVGFLYYFLMVRPPGRSAPASSPERMRELREAAAANRPADPGPEPDRLTLGDVHGPWIEDLRAWDAAFEDWVAGRFDAPDGPAPSSAAAVGLDPAGLPPSPVATALDPGPLIPEGPHRTRTDAARARVAFWEAQIDAYATSRPLTDGERALLAEVGRLALPALDLQQRPSRWKAAAETVRDATTDDPLVAAHLAWADAHDGEVTADDVDAAGRAAADLAAADGVPPLFALRVPLWWWQAAEGAAEGAAAEERTAAAKTATLEGLTTFVIAADPDGDLAADHPHLPKFVYDFARDLMKLVPAGEGTLLGSDPRAADHLDIHPDRLRVLRAVSDGAAAGGDRYALHCLLGGAYIDAAWDARGGGFAGEVSGGAWPVFERRIAVGRQHMHAAYLLRPDLPLAPTGLITTALAGGGVLDADRWFRRAVAAQVDYLPAYRNVRSALQPRWGGSVGALVELAGETLRPDLAETGASGEGWRLLRLIRSESTGGWGEPPPDRWREVLAAHIDLYLARRGADAVGGPAWWDFDAKTYGAVVGAAADAGLRGRRVALLRAWPGDRPEPRAGLDGYRRAWLLGPELAADGPAAAAAARLAAAVAPDADAVPESDLPGLLADAAAAAAAADSGDVVVADWAGECELVLGWVRDAYAGADDDGPGGAVSLPIEPDLRGFRCGTSSRKVEGGVVELWSDGGKNRGYLEPLVPFPAPVLASAEIQILPNGGAGGGAAYENRFGGIGVGRSPWWDGSAARPGADEGEEAEATGGILMVFENMRRQWTVVDYSAVPKTGGFRDPRAMRGLLDRYIVHLLARPGDAAWFYGARYFGRLSGRGPEGPMRLRFGVPQRAAGWVHVRVSDVSVRHRPDFTAPAGFREVPDDLRSPTDSPGPPEPPGGA